MENNFLNDLKDNFISHEINVNVHDKHGVDFFQLSRGDKFLHFTIGPYENYTEPSSLHIDQCLINYNKIKKHCCLAHLTKKQFFVIIILNFDNELDILPINVVCPCRIALWFNTYGFNDEIINYFN